jgi:hypothetical protein
MWLLQFQMVKRIRSSLLSLKGLVEIKLLQDDTTLMARLLKRS